MSSLNGLVTLTVQSGTSTDIWTWQDPRDATTPSEIHGKRGGLPLVALAAIDKAPTR